MGRGGSRGKGRVKRDKTHRDYSWCVAGALTCTSKRDLLPPAVLQRYRFVSVCFVLACGGLRASFLPSPITPAFRLLAAMLAPPPPP